MTDARRTLRLIHEEIDARVGAIAGARAWWPCRAGCDACCRSLVVPPSSNEAEWELLREAVDALDRVARDGVMRRARELRDAMREAPAGARWTCPLLDEQSGRCLTYAARPTACRTYGFYATREAGKHCALVSDAVAQHEGDAIVWGNQEAIERRLDAAGGAPRSLLERLAEAQTRG